ncbi:MAG: hypothetical protein ACYDH9_08820 [Limisphaerales bacterium]
MKTKPDNPIEEIWRIRDELAAEEGDDPRKVFDLLRREEKKYGDRVRPLRGPAKEPALLREEPLPYGRKQRKKF